MRTNLSQYFYIINNSYISVFENLEQIGRNLKQTLEKEIQDETDRQLFLVFWRLVFYAAVFVLMVFVLAKIYLKTGDTWQYYGFVQQTWI